jgi:osmoprotectant transport system ATP-binding protein
LQRELKSIFQNLSKTVLMVTHDMGEAAYFADQIVLMSRGEIIQQGRVEDLVNNPKDPFVTRFISAQQNPLDKYTGNT